MPSEEMVHEGQHLVGAGTGNKVAGPRGTAPRVGCRPGHVAEATSAQSRAGCHAGESRAGPGRRPAGAACGPRPARPPQKRSNPSFLRMCSEPSRGSSELVKIFLCGAIPVFPLIKVFLGSWQQYGVLQKRSAFQGKHSSSRPGPRRGEPLFWGSLCSGPWSGMWDAGSGPGAHCREGSATAAQDPWALPAQDVPRPAPPPGVSRLINAPLRSCSGPSTTQTEKASLAQKSTDFAG